MMSSASKPGSFSTGTPIAFSTLSIIGSWAIKSSGGGSRWPLYSGKRSLRNVGSSVSKVASR